MSVRIENQLPSERAPGGEGLQTTLTRNAAASTGGTVTPPDADVDSIRVTGQSKLTGDVTLTPGTNISMTQTGQDISISASAGSGGGTGGGFEIVWQYDGSAFVNWTYSTSITTPLFSNAALYSKVDLTGYVQARLVAEIGQPNTPNGYLVAQYSTDGGTTWHNLDGGTGPRIDLSLGTSGGALIVSSWVTITAGALGDVILRVAFVAATVGVAGIGAEIGAVSIQVSPVAGGSPTGAAGGDLTGTYPNPTIGANKVGNTKLAQMTAHTYKGNNTGSTADPSNVSAANVLADVSPLTTKGDLLGFSTVNARVPIGSNDQFVVADSAQTLGLKYATRTRGCLITLCAGFTPAGTGADIAEFMVPFDPADGTTSITWTIERINFRVGTAGGAPAVKLQKSSAGDAVFGAGTDVATITLTSGHNQGNSTGSLGTVVSGDLLRFNVVTLATATNWTVDVLLSAALNT